MRISDWSSDVCSSDLPCSKARTALPPLPGVRLRRCLTPLCADDLAILRCLTPTEPDTCNFPAHPQAQPILAGASPDRKSVVSGKRVSGRVDLGGCRIMKKKKND